MKFDNSESTNATQPPGLGEHTEDILAEMGRSESEVKSLRAQGAI